MVIVLIAGHDLFLLNSRRSKVNASRCKGKARRYMSVARRSPTFSRPCEGEARRPMNKARRSIVESCRHIN